MNAKFRSMSLVFILVLIEIYFLVNGGAHFSTWGAIEQQTITIYILMVVSFMLFAGRETAKEMNIPLPSALVNFVGFFIATYFVLAAITYFSGSTVLPMDPSLFWPTVVMQVAVVATSEELMFRGVLLEKFGIIVSSILFAGWHTYAYGVRYYAIDTFSIQLIIPFVVAFLIVSFNSHLSVRLYPIDKYRFE